MHVVQAVVAVAERTVFHPVRNYLADLQWDGKPRLDRLLADYFGAGLVTLGELIRCDFTPYPNVVRWLHNMKKLKSWPQANEAFYGLASHLKDQPFVAL